MIPAFCCHCLELLKGNVKFDFQCVISIDVDRFDELRNNHLLCSKGTAIIEIGPGLYLFIFLPLYISIGNMCVQFRLCCLYSGFLLLDFGFDFAYKFIEKIHVKLALSADCLDTFVLVIDQFFFLVR